MMASALGFSLMPLAIALAGRDSPFLMTAALKAGSVLGYTAYLAAAHRDTLTHASTWKLVAQRILSSPLRIGSQTLHSPLPMLLAAATYLDYTLLALSMRHISPAIAAVLYESWPVLLMAITARLFRGDHTYASTGVNTYTLTALALGGAVLVVLSQSHGVHQETATLADMFTGYALLLLAIALAPLSAFGLRWGVDLGTTLARPGDSPTTRRQLHLAGTVTANLLGNAATLPVTLTAATLVFRETIDARTALATLATGAAVLATANICWRHANIITRHLGVNALSYSTPVLALLWLMLLGQAGPVQPRLIIPGTTAILLANLLIHITASRTKREETTA